MKLKLTKKKKRIKKKFNMDNINLLEKKINFKFKNESLLYEALTHRSYLNENKSWPYHHNERLEFLGDAVLELVITELLFNYYPDAQEGDMTLLRAALVNYQKLAEIAQSIGLEKFLYLSKGEAKDLPKSQEVILADAFEALIGAIYLDAKLEAAKKFVKKFVFSRLDEVLATKSYKDAKSELQEIVQDKLKITPVYKVLSESGPAHERIFESGVYFDGKLIAKGEGRAKQESEIEAAKAALKKIDNGELIF